MGLNYHNLKKHRRNFLDITGFIFEYIEIFYNKQRRHSIINYCIPEKFDSSFS
ncbi:hypothetical protein IYZ83_001160 [Wolbachia pipientis]|uniref:hypothetical protein n=1 Tax=Wolbachia pipientis TaxID=955 RepID=UPI001F1C5B08|nr:hypothetical protein [Wolbachia pipientis]UIP91856.1 hypothetical protein IYZ83_001160 [Wolbachia pipientis]